MNKPSKKEGGNFVPSSSSSPLFHGVQIEMVRQHNTGGLVRKYNSRWKKEVEARSADDTRVCSVGNKKYRARRIAMSIGDRSRSVEKRHSTIPNDPSFVVSSFLHSTRAFLSPKERFTRKICTGKAFERWLEENRFSTNVILGCY